MTIPRIILAILLLCVPARADDPRLPALPPGHSWNWSRVRYDYSGLEVAAESAAPTGPLLSTWNTGETQRKQEDGDVSGVKGFTPDWQHARIVAGEPILPAFELFNRPVTYQSQQYYYEPLLSHCAANSLPISIVMQNLADMFRVRRDWPWYYADGDQSYNALPDDAHPWIVKLNDDGTKDVDRVTCPWGSVEPWHRAGQLIGEQIAGSIAVGYPDPPVVYLMDNGEVGFSGTGDEYALALDDYRCPPDLKACVAAAEADASLIALGDKPGRFISNRYAADGYRVRLGEFRRGLNDAFPAGWKGKVVLSKYGVWGNEFGRVDNQWRNADPFGTLGRVYDGVACNVGYLHDWSAAMPWFTRCPQFEACNTAMGLRHFRNGYRPDFYCETLFWNGKRSKGVTPEIWTGMVRQVLWTTRPDNVRYYSGSTKPVGGELVDYEPVLAAVREIRDNPVLSRFWKRGVLLKNEWRALPKLFAHDSIDGYGHLYRYVPPHSDFAENHWFQQNVPLNARVRIDPYRTTGVHKENWRQSGYRIKVNAICLQDGDEYLILASAPDGPQTGVEIQVCPDGPEPRFSVTVDVPADGAFFHRLADGSIE